MKERDWNIYYKESEHLQNWMVHGTIRTVHTTYAAALNTTSIQKLVAENHMLQLNI